MTFTSLGFNVLISKMQQIEFLPHRIVVKIKMFSRSKVLRMLSDLRLAVSCLNGVRARCLEVW